MIRRYTKNRFWSVYQIRNLSNGKSYIGITSKSLAQRMWEHVRDADTGCRYALHSAIRKYGEESFEIQLLETAEDLYEAQALESAFIIDLDTIADGRRDGGGYNMSFGGEMPDI